MSAQEVQNDTHLTDGVFKAPSAVFEGGKKEFQPWHKPRKQYIRTFQWDKEARELIDEIEFRDSRPLSYMGLPGEDMFDIRALSKICLEKDLEIKYLGFNSASDNGRATEQTISENEMIHIPNVHKASKTIIDYIQRVANKDSQAYNTMASMGPFDLINLDLCSSVAQMAQAHNTGNYRLFDAIYQILNYQTETRIQPWILFLTTRGEQAIVNPNDWEKLWNCLHENIQEYADFRSKLEGLVGCPLGVCNSVDDLRLEVYKFVQLFSVGVGKWLIKTMMSAEPKCTVTMLDSYCYRVSTSRNPNMISAAFLFRPFTRPPENIGNLVREEVQGKPSEEICLVDLECSLVDTVSNLKDVDLLLHQNNRVHDQMVAETKGLLKQARYNIDDYNTWEQRNQLVI